MCIMWLIPTVTFCQEEVKCFFEDIGNILVPLTFYHLNTQTIIQLIFRRNRKGKKTAFWWKKIQI